MAKNWETESTSCISINISESTASYDDFHDGGLSSLTEGEVVNSATTLQTLFDDESGVLPIDPNGDRRNTGDGDARTDAFGQGEQSIADASSIRRKHSSSTIVSYYDKSKVPLVISQQTSSSAMAKGLPLKASSLLDMDGTLARTADDARKKPTKLDLSRIFSSRRLLGSASIHTDGNNNAGVSANTLANTPPFMLVSPSERVDRPASSHRNERKLRPSTRGSVRAKLSGQVSPKQTTPNGRYRVSQEAVGLRNLYDHYERMTYRDVTATDDGGSLLEEGLDLACSPRSITTQTASTFGGARALSAVGGPTEDVPVHEALPLNLEGGLESSSLLSGVDTPLLHTRVAKYSESISSRHTRTSRQTAQSFGFGDLDLQQNSVLSLSSDSEDENVGVRPHKSAPASTMSTRPPKAVAVGSGRPQSPVRRGSRCEPLDRNPTTASLNQKEPLKSVPRNTAMTTTTQGLVLLPNLRSTSASASTRTSVVSPKTAAFSRTRVSEASRISMMTVNSADQTNYTVHEARAVTIVPAQGASCNSAVKQGGSASSSRLTPPLSPASVDLFLHSKHTSRLGTDHGSVRSSGSFATTGSGWSVANGQNRIMAVTRQEEMLLAALRMKRVRMRESLLAEFEETQENVADAIQSRSEVADEPNCANINANLKLHAPKPRSGNRGSVSFRDFPTHFGDNATLYPMLTTDNQFSTTTNSGHSPEASVRWRPAVARKSLACVDKIGCGSAHDYVPLYFDSSSERSPDASSMTNSDRLCHFYFGDTSPNLSDCLDLDDAYSASLGSYECPSFQTPADQSPLDAASMDRQAVQNEQSLWNRSHGGTSSGPTITAQKAGPEGFQHPNHSCRVDILDDSVGTSLGHHDDSEVDNDIRHSFPRPESPVGSDPLPVPRKKAVRISAVGKVGMEAGWWGDDG
ncbi:hypothetical protein SPI_07507 [Niveomyces insectorum RCEF 264]|uniref:Uncharacterized protein n=1 Tax=Niveomyces insectorum RCEF 264 TaxID=1081102 RepID=A0A167PXU8_9HYPO|nr:hypothetical protein SPI_07507 [Niveomyces insectorum RCEF 264]